MPCKLRPRADNPDLPDREATVGDEVTLETTNVDGSVLIAKAVYADKDLVPDGEVVPRITFAVVAGEKVLTITFVFSQGVNGRGRLQEDCSGTSEVLRQVAGHQPQQHILIVGR